MRGISWLAQKPVSFSKGTLLHGLSKLVYVVQCKKLLILEQLLTREIKNTNTESAVACFVVISWNMVVGQSNTTKSLGLADVLDGIRSKSLPNVNQNLCCCTQIAQVRRDILTVSSSWFVTKCPQLNYRWTTFVNNFMCCSWQPSP